MPSSSRGPGLAATALLLLAPAVVFAGNPNFSNVPHGRCPNGLKCHHGGVCAVGDKDYTTEHPVPSADLPWLEELNVNGEHCTDCHEGYGGVDCGRKYQVCDASDPDAPTCFNGSTCWKKGIGSNGRYEYMCDCTQAGHDGVKYAGKFCQHVQEETCDDSMFCTNGGKCTSVASAFGGHAHYECECPSHRAGTHCEFLAEEGFSDCRLDCERGVCAKGFKSYDGLVGTGPFPAKLVFDIISSGGEHCVCPDGYTGLRCEIEVDKCGDAKYNCYNGAKCSYDRSGNPVCDCNSAHTDETSYAGLACEHESTTFCTPGMDQDQKDAFCTNHGRCITDPDAAHRGCECEEGWSGDLCEIEGDVEPVCDLDCKNGGSCRLGVKGYKDAYDDLNLAVHAKKQQDGMYCSCPEGFTGLQCETDVSHCHNDEHESEHFCLNGVPCDPTNANSVMKKYSCQCDEGHDEISQMLAGRFCEYAVTEFCAKDTARHSHSFCTNGGKCKQYNDHDDTEHHGCCCPEGYEGEFCQLPEGTLGGSKPVTWSPLEECQREKTPAQNDVVYPVAPNNNNKEYDTWNAWPHGGWEAVHDTPTTQETPVNHKISASKEAKEEATMEDAVLTSTEPEESPDKSNAGGIVSGILLSLLVVGGVAGVAYRKRSMKQDPHQFESNWWEGHNTQWWKGDSDVESRDTNIAPRPSPSVSSALRKTWSYPEEHVLSKDEMDGKREYSKDHGELHDVMI